MSKQTDAKLIDIRTPPPRRRTAWRSAGAWCSRASGAFWTWRSSTPTRRRAPRPRPTARCSCWPRTACRCWRRRARCRACCCRRAAGACADCVHFACGVHTNAHCAHACTRSQHVRLLRLFGACARPFDAHTSSNPCIAIALHPRIAAAQGGAAGHVRRASGHTLRADVGRLQPERVWRRAVPRRGLPAAAPGRAGHHRDDGARGALCTCCTALLVGCILPWKQDVLAAIEMTCTCGAPCAVSHVLYCSGGCILPWKHGVLATVDNLFHCKG